MSTSEVPEGYVPTTAENMEYHSITLGAIQTAALLLSTPPPTLQTTVAMSSHSIPTGSVLPTLVLQHNHAGKETYRWINQMHARCSIKLQSCKHSPYNYVSVYLEFLIFTCQQDPVNYTQNFSTMQHWNLNDVVTSVRSD